jgi:hypothetical protein
VGPERIAGFVDQKSAQRQRHLALGWRFGRQVRIEERDPGVQAAAIYEQHPGVAGMCRGRPRLFADGLIHFAQGQVAGAKEHSKAVLLRLAINYGGARLDHALRVAKDDRGRAFVRLDFVEDPLLDHGLSPETRFLGETGFLGKLDPGQIDGIVQALVGGPQLTAQGFG